MKHAAEQHDGYGARRPILAVQQAQEGSVAAPQQGYPQQAQLAPGLAAHAELRAGLLDDVVSHSVDTGGPNDDDEEDDPAWDVSDA